MQQNDSTTILSIDAVYCNCCCTSTSDKTRVCWRCGLVKNPHQTTADGSSVLTASAANDVTSVQLQQMHSLKASTTGTPEGEFQAFGEESLNNNSNHSDSQPVARATSPQEAPGPEIKPSQNELSTGPQLTTAPPAAVASKASLMKEIIQFGGLSGGNLSSAKHMDGKKKVVAGPVASERTFSDVLASLRKGLTHRIYILEILE